MPSSPVPHDVCKMCLFVEPGHRSSCVDGEIDMCSAHLDNLPEICEGSQYGFCADSTGIEKHATEQNSGTMHCATTWVGNNLAASMWNIAELYCRTVHCQSAPVRRGQSALYATASSPARDPMSGSDHGPPMPAVDGSFCAPPWFHTLLCWVEAVLPREPRKAPTQPYRYGSIPPSCMYRQGRGLVCWCGKSGIACTVGGAAQSQLGTLSPNDDATVHGATPWIALSWCFLTLPPVRRGRVAFPANLGVTGDRDQRACIPEATSGACMWQWQKLSCPPLFCITHLSFAEYPCFVEDTGNCNFCPRLGSSHVVCVVCWG
jgi:hypothetical protein